MSRILTLEVPDELYAALEQAARNESRSPEEVGLAQWQAAFGARAKNGAGKLKFRDDDPLAKLIGTIDSRGSEDWADNHDHYIGRGLLDTHEDEAA